jgi:hypothetical protein
MITDITAMVLSPSISGLYFSSIYKFRSNESIHRINAVTDIRFFVYRSEASARGPSANIRLSGKIPPKISMIAYQINIPVQASANQTFSADYTVVLARNNACSVGTGAIIAPAGKPKHAHEQMQKPTPHPDHDHPKAVNSRRKSILVFPYKTGSSAIEQPCRSFPDYCKVELATRSCKLNSRYFSGMKKHKFVFIGGLHRSGTTLLERIIESHGNITGHEKGIAPYMEGQLFQSVYPSDQKLGGVGRFAFNSESHLTEKSPLVTDKNRELLFAEWSEYWDLDKPLLLEKSPPNGIKSRFLQELFPDSYFIFVIRHPFAVSLATQKWSKTSLLSLVEHWITYNEIMMNDYEHIKNRIIIRYEDFVSNPAKTLNQISV